jgi:DMSO/TMAO reductase YedYZ heme-binding membrane subunit
VTAAFKVISAPHSQLIHVLLRVWPIVPVLYLLRSIFAGRLLNYADIVIGYDAVLCLVACLAITPFITVARLKIAKLRWWYGMWVFFLGAAGLAIHLAYPPGSIAARAGGNAVDWTGLLIVALLLPMAATSSVAAQKLLGQEWKRWQRSLIWLVWASVGIHLALMHSWVALGAYGAATMPAVLLRRPWVRKSVKQWRAGGYSTGGWWLALGIVGSVALVGVMVLIGEEVTAVVRAITLARS